MHDDVPRAEDTDWPQIAALYEVLLRRQPSPVIELNRTVAVARCEGPAAGLVLVEAILAQRQFIARPLAQL